MQAYDKLQSTVCGPHTFRLGERGVTKQRPLDSTPPVPPSSFSNPEEIVAFVKTEGTYLTQSIPFQRADAILKTVRGLEKQALALDDKDPRDLDKRPGSVLTYAGNSPTTLPRAEMAVEARVGGPFYAVDDMCNAHLGYAHEEPCPHVEVYTALTLSDPIRTARETVTLDHVRGTLTYLLD